MITKEAQIEQALIDKLGDLKYSYRKDIRTERALKQNFREKFEALNFVSLTDNEFERLYQDIITADVLKPLKRCVNVVTFSVKMAHHYITP